MMEDERKPLSEVDRARSIRREQRKAHSKELTATIAKDNHPLTLKELRQMVDWPVWVEVLDHDVFADQADDFDGWGMVRESWVRIWDEARADLIHIDYDFESYGKEWVAYKMPVRHGYWIKVTEICGIEILKCSECQISHPRLRDAFCRDCGAKMDLEVSDKST